MAVKKLEVMCETVSMGVGDFREEVRLACNRMLLKCKTNNWIYEGMEITKISGSIEVTMLLITVIYSI